MSLFTPPSTIRKLIMEAEELTLPPSEASQEIQANTAASPADVAADMSANMPQEPAGGQTLSMPQISAPASTISKTVINKDIILSQLAELKSVVTNYEKQFEGEDLTPEDASVYISSLLSTLVFHAEKLNSFMESTPSAEGTQTPPMQ